MYAYGQSQVSQSSNVEKSRLLHKIIDIKGGQIEDETKKPSIKGQIKPHYSQVIILKTVGAKFK